jgi:cell wall-associated NlpC family hydrolase
MVSQVLFGELLSILGESGDFIRVRMLEAAYEGWVQGAQLIKLDTSEEEPYAIVGLDGAVLGNAVRHTKLYHGTPVFRKSFRLGDELFEIKGTLRQPSLTDFVEEFPKLIQYYMHTPYLWGGRSLCGIDCSGFSQVVYRHFGIQLKRDAYQQADAGRTVDFLSEIKPGDLAFFDNEEGRITHVGIMVDGETIVHASGEVRVDKMDQQGIYNQEAGRNSHRLRIVKRYF